MDFKDLIKTRRLEIGKTLEEVGRVVGVSKTTVQRWESGDIANLRRDKIAKLAIALEVSPAYLMGWEESLSPGLPSNIIPLPKFKKRIPILGTIACGQPILAVEERMDYIELDELLDADFALHCQGDSMIDARILDGDVVVIREQPTVENGEIAAVLICDGADEAEATLKKVYYKKDSIILRPCNAMYDDIEYHGEEMNNVRILGKAVYFISAVK